MAHVTTNAPTSAPPAVKRRSFGEMLSTELRALPIVLGLIVLWIFFSLQSDVFLTPRNLSNLLIQSTVVGIMALGLMFVLLVKEIDLSVAAINGLTSVFMAKIIVDFGVSPWIAVPAAILLGAFIGSLSARWVTYVGVPSFVVTLGLGLALNGLQLILLPATARYSLNGTGIERIALTNITGVWGWLIFLLAIAAFAALVLSKVSSRKKAGLETAFLKSVALPILAAAVFGFGVVSILMANAGIPLVVLIFAVLLGIGGYILQETRFGLYLYAVGNNDEAARRTGINVSRIKMAAFAIAGGIAALAGVRRLVAHLGCRCLFRGRGRRRHAAAGIHCRCGDRRGQPVWRPGCHPCGAVGRTRDRHGRQRPQPDGCRERDPSDRDRLPACPCRVDRQADRESHRPTKLLKMVSAPIKGWAHSKHCTQGRVL